MKSEKKNYPGVNIGSASMLVIFIILCLVTFAVLSVASANKDYAYSRKSAQRTAAYHQAANQAEGLLDQIDNILKDTYLQRGDSYLEEIPRELQELTEVDTSFFPTVSFQIAINETQALYVCLSLEVPKEPGDTLYRITAWQEVSTEEWEGATSLNLM